MKKHKLSQRLNQMAKWIEQNSSIADIGTDHGYLPYALFEQNRIKSAILCDINKGPLENSKKTFQGSSHLQKVQFRLGSGIEPLQNAEVDYLIIAGMGGSLIKEILKKNIQKTYSYKGFFLQPQTEQDVLRAWLLENQFSIVTDFYAFEDQKFYEALFVLPTCETSNEVPFLPLIETSKNAYKVYETSKDLEFGYKVHPECLEVYLAYLEHKRHKYQLIQSKIKLDNSPKYVECQQKLEQIDQLLTSLKNA